jgi:uncharacterized membrane protein
MIGSLPPDQWASVLRWLGWMALAGVLARPLALRLMPGEGGGWITGKLLGWLIAGWVPWCLAAFHILPFDKASMAGVLVLALLALRSGLGPRDLRGALTVEGAFLVLFWLGLAAKLIHADLTGLEKFTDMGFLSAAMRAETMPPQDAWFAGHGLNYYYVGQAMVGTWGNLAGVSPDHAYPLAMATIFALTALGAFHVTARLAAPWGQRLAAVLGGFAGILTVYGGNGHSVLYQLFRDWMPTTKADFFYPDSTRFIGFDPDTLDKGFTEFFGYGIAAGDLHAHLVAMPLFLLAVALVLAILRRGLLGSLPMPAQSLAFGWTLGLGLMMNSWDLAIIGLLAVVALAVVLSRPTGAGMPSLAIRVDSLGAATILAFAAAALTAAPFLASFKPFANGVLPVASRTPLWQLLVIYAHVLPAILLIPMLALRRNQVVPLLPIAVVAVTGLLLVAIPEVIFLKDIYGDDHARANTMFKLTFRAQTLLVVAGCAALAPALSRRGLWTGAGLAAMVPLGLALAYLPHVYAPPSVIRSLDGLAFLGDERALVEAARTLPLTPGEALVEATGKAFTDTSRVSALTGQPAVIGWTGHEWLWRNDVAGAYDRAHDVDRFYTTTDRVERCRIVRRYGIRYVVIGKIERREYPALDLAGLEALGPPVHDGPGGIILRIDPATCLE